MCSATRAPRQDAGEPLGLVEEELDGATDVYVITGAIRKSRKVGVDEGNSGERKNMKSSIPSEWVSVGSTQEDGTLNGSNALAFKKCECLRLSAVDRGEGEDARMKQCKGRCAAAYYDDAPRPTKPRVFKGGRIHGSERVVFIASAGAATSGCLKRDPEHISHDSAGAGCSYYHYA